MAIQYSIISICQNFLSLSSLIGHWGRIPCFTTVIILFYALFGVFWTLNQASLHPWSGPIC